MISFKHIYIKIMIHAYLVKKHLAIRAPLPAVDRVGTQFAKMLLNIYRRRNISVLSGFLVPAELMHVYGTAPMFVEVLSAVIASAGLGQRSLEYAETAGFSRDSCTFHRTALGAGLNGFLPKFKLVAATSHLCDGQSKALEELADRTGAPYILLDVPQESTAAAVNYLSAQLAELEDMLAALTGRRATPSHWQRVFSLSNETRDLMLKVGRLRSTQADRFFGLDAFNLALLAMLTMGTPFLRDCYRDLQHDLENAPVNAGDGGARFRIVWMLAYPYFQGNFISDLEDRLGVRSVAEELGQVYWSPLNPERPLQSLAVKMLQNPNLGPVANRVRLTEKLVEEYAPDGVLHFSHWGCRQGCGGVRPIADAMQRCNVPFLDLGGDCIDGRNYASGQTRTRIEGFVELMAKKDLNEHGKVMQPNGFYLGVDIGSQSAKAVVVDAAERIVFSTVILTGASSRRSAEKLKEAVWGNSAFSGKIRRCVATGYGRNAVDFADEQVTEITCHARGLAHQASGGVHRIIDIGGQDTKAICVAQNGIVTRFVMNDKCAAGTGRFLEMMARALEIDLEELGPLALQAKKTVTISSLCTVFAESEVISLIAEGVSSAAIARGICDSIASRTVSLLARISGNGAVAMSGGVAKNVGVVKALEQKLGKPMVIPPEPQIIGALGAALIATQKGV